MIEVTDEIRRTYAEAWFRAIGMDEEDVAQMAGSEVADPMPWRDAALTAVLAIVERDRITEVTHLVWPDRGTTACCNRTPFELTRTDRFTTDMQATTCPVRTAT